MKTYSSGRCAIVHHCVRESATSALAKSQLTFVCAHYITLKARCQLNEATLPCVPKLDNRGRSRIISGREEQKGAVFLLLSVSQTDVHVGLNVPEQG